MKNREKKISSHLRIRIRKLLLATGIYKEQFVLEKPDCFFSNRIIKLVDEGNTMDLICLDFSKDLIHKSYSKLIQIGLATPPHGMKNWLEIHK